MQEFTGIMNGKMEINIIQMIGGIGNQMFQYALYRKFIEIGVQTKYEHFRTNQYHNGFVLNKVFNIEENPINSVEEADQLERYQEQTWPTFNTAILEKRNVYLCGNWQNIGYFPSENILRKDFTFKMELDDPNKNILYKIVESNSVSIHIRKGDYTTGHNNGYFFQADWMNYYGQAVGTILKKVDKNTKFFIFSDDINWAKKNTFIPNAVFVQENKGNDSWKDMYLMSKCKHNITANSTFSWWGAWLNENTQKIIITPKKWFNNNIDSNLITLNNWIKI